MSTVIHEDLSRYGVSLARGLIEPALAMAVDQRLRANLDRLSCVFPNYAEDANRNVFPISIAMAADTDATLPQRMQEAARTNILDPHFATRQEVEALHSFVAPIIEKLEAYRLAGLDNCYARFEKARANSPYSTRAIHQDHVFGFRGLTAWIALSPCGRDAPALQFVRKKQRDRFPTENQTFISSRRFWPWQWERPAYEPGDVVIFDALTVHGTHINRRMRLARTSLDVRFALA